MRLLLVEDNARLAAWLAKALEQSGYAVDTVGDGGAALAHLQSDDYDIAVLDLFLPGLDGMECLRRMRRAGSRLPVLVLTANGEMEARLRALELGADDYLTKPFELAELEARLKAILRRTLNQGLQQLACGSLVYEVAERAFRLGGEHLSLPPKEQAVLETLMQRLGRPVRKEAIYEKIYGVDANTGQDAIEIYVHRLRRRLAQAGLDIALLRGLGYLLRKTHTESEPKASLNRAESAPA